MDVNKFISSLDIFQNDDDQYVGVKSTSALLISIGLLVFPASALRWDGSIRSPLDQRQLTQIEQQRLLPNAMLNRTLRVMSALVGLGLAGYAATLDTKDLANIEIKRMKEEARTIFATETINAKLIEVLPEDKTSQEEPQALPPAAQKAMSLFLKKPTKSAATDDDDDLEALAAKKFTLKNKAATASVTAKTNEDMLKARNTQINEAISHIEQPAVQSDDAPPIDKYAKFKEIGKNIIEGMVITEKSILIASGTGTGKTTTEQYLLDGLIKHYPTTTFYALLQKNDQLTGVREENRQVFDNMQLTAYLNQGSADDKEDGDAAPRILLESILSPLFRVYAEFCRRKELPAIERERLKDESPIRLILADWFATYQELLRLNKKDLGHVLSMVRGIITVGRDSGVALIVDTQSGALASLGLAEDASIRESLDIYSQGYVRWVKNREKGDVRTMLQMIDNNSMVSKEDREGIKRAYLLLTKGINEGEITSPIIFTTVGSCPSIGIAPNLSHMTVRANEQSTPITQSATATAIGITPVDRTPTPPVQIITPEVRYTRFNLNRELAQQQILALLAAGQNQTQVIKYFWDANPGGSKSYESAKAQFEELTRDDIS